MSTQEILTKYLDFYKAKGHIQIPNVSLVPENDPSLLFVNSGMFPLVHYLMGTQHPEGKRITNVQRCLRLDDIENVGNTNRHTTVFHMLGNWSLGDYFKKEQLNWTYEFYIEILNLDPNKLFASVFEGDENVHKDEESIKILEEIFKKYGVSTEGRVFACGKKDNWWQRGETMGELGGPDSETFYYIGDGSMEGKNPIENQDEFLEIGNSVFMQYIRSEAGWDELPQKNVDFGGGLERIALVVQKKKDIFQTDSFWPIIEEIQRLSNKNYGENEKSTKQMRIIADHIRATCLISMDGVLPSNKEQGYILRRLLRRMFRLGRELDIGRGFPTPLVGAVCNTLNWIYPELTTKRKLIETIFLEEEAKFAKTLDQGAKYIKKELSSREKLSENEIANIASRAYQSLGYPPELTVEDIKDQGIDFDAEEIFKVIAEKSKKHQETSREGASQKFTGGLADQSATTIKYHTLTHILHWALRQILGGHIQQQGSNITGERLRFDFSHNEKLTGEQLIQIENLINKTISQEFKVGYEIMTKEEAEKIGAIHLFDEKYKDKVKVYYLGENIERAFSKEFCGGPHVQNTSEIPPIHIVKQEKIGGDKIRVYLKFITS